MLTSAKPMMPKRPPPAPTRAMPTTLERRTIPVAVNEPLTALNPQITLEDAGASVVCPSAHTPGMPAPTSYGIAAVWRNRSRSPRMSAFSPPHERDAVMRATSSE